VGFRGERLHDIARAMWVIILFGIILAGAGAAIMYGQMPNLRRRSRIMAMPTSAIAQAPGNGLVEIKGRILPSEQGVMQTPFSNRPAVWARITVQEWQQRGRSGSWINILTDADGRHFMVEDGSGQVARVLPQGANFILEQNEAARSGTFRDANPQLKAFLQARGLKSTSFLGLNKGMRYLEEVLAPGDALYALGPSRREPGPPVSDGYRMVPSSMLVMAAGGGGLNAQELILTNRTEAQIVSKLLRGFIGGAVMLGLGTLGLVGCLMWWIEGLLEK
jgi:hypothetical protein